MVIGLASSGPHSNGYSLVRKLLEVSAGELPTTARRPRRSSSGCWRRHASTCKLAAGADGERAGARPARTSPAAGSGNIPRVLPEGSVVLERSRWPRPALFDWLQRTGRIDEAEMYRTFNCGIGMVAIVPPRAPEAARSCSMRTANRRCSSAKCARAIGARSSRHEQAARCAAARGTDLRPRQQHARDRARLRRRADPRPGAGCRSQIAQASPAWRPPGIGYRGSSRSPGRARTTAKRSSARGEALERSGAQLDGARRLHAHPVAAFVDRAPGAC